VVHLDGRSVKFDDEQRLHIKRIVRMDKFFHCVNGRPVHHFHAAGNDAGGNYIGHALARILVCRKAHQDDTGRFRLLQEPHCNLGDYPEEALRTGEHAEQVQPVAVQMFAAKPDYLAADQHHFDAQYIVGGEAVFQAVHPAGIFRHIAANGAGDLRGRVGRIVETLVLDCLGYGEIRHPRLHHGAAVVIVDFQHPVEFRKPKNNAVGQRQGSAG